MVAVGGITRFRTLISGSTSVTLGAVAGVNVLRIFSTIILTRLLDASAFGIIGLIASVQFMLIMLSEVGLFAFIVRHPEAENPDFLDEVWTIRILRSLLLTAAMAAVAFPVSWFTQQPEMAPVLIASSINFALEGLSSLAFATSVRRNQLKRLAGYDLIVMVLQLVISVTLAYATGSYWGLIVAGIVVSTLKILFSYIYFPNNRRRWKLSRERASEIWRFSRMLASSSALSLIIAQADKIVFARIMPLATFGIYTIAWSLATAPMMLSAPYAERIIYPGIASDQRDGLDLRRSFYRRRSKVILGYAFLVGGFIGTADLIVEILYDPRYRQVAPFLQILSISTLAAMFSSTSLQALLALGRTSWAFHATASRAGWLAVGGLAALVQHEPMILVWTVGLMEVAGMVALWIGLHRAQMFDLRSELPPFAAALIGFGIGAAGSNILLPLVGPLLGNP